MKPLIYCISFILVAVSLSSCSKKDEGAGLPPQAGQQQASSVQEMEKFPAFNLVPVPNQDKLVLSLDEVEQILKTAGLSDLQIKEYGTSFRDALANSGAVRILNDNVVEVGFAVRGDEVFVSSRSRGYFIYSIKTGWKNLQKQ